MVNKKLERVSPITLRKERIMYWLDIFNIFKREKKIAIVTFDKPDIVYQEWELGRVIGEILEICWLLKPPLKKEVKEGFLIKKITDSFRVLESLYKSLSQEPKIFGFIEDLSKKIEETRNKICLKKFNAIVVQRKVEYIQEIIQCELRGRSIHLYHIFLLALKLRKLVTMLLYNIKSEEIESFIKDNITLIEKIEKGDKVLISPNLEISTQN